METQCVRFDSASELLDHLQATSSFTVDAPIDVDGIAKALGFQVEYDDTLESRDVIGEIFFNECRPIVKINPIQNSYEPRRRFTLAHEIGHYCLHSSESMTSFTDSQKTMSRTESYWSRYESEANAFAAQLLMPKNLILRDGREIIDRCKAELGVSAIPAQTFIERMADRFDVSSKAMEYRLKNLGVIKQGA